VDTRRAESFSDGVFAVAITVLVFNLLPIAKAGITLKDLLDAWPRYAGYVVSFLTIGIVWLNHHSMFARLRRVNRPLLAINLGLLITVVAIPFTTALAAANLAPGSSASGARLATVVYGLVMIAMSIAFSGLWVYLSVHRTDLIATPLRSPLQGWMRFSAGLVGYIAATLIAAFVSPGASLAIYGVIAVYYLFENLPDQSAPDDGEAGDSAEADAGDEAAGSAETADADDAGDGDEAGQAGATSSGQDAPR
jgi:uncharacterized membrane protein